MATPADQRLLELLEKWLKSLELHAKYSSLDDDSYWKIQPWVEHQRPTRWVIDVAMQKTLALRAHVQERVKMGDAKYSESLELMTFLANLVGSEHIERFIPMAAAENERSLTSESRDGAALAILAGGRATPENPRQELPVPARPSMLSGGCRFVVHGEFLKQFNVSHKRGTGQDAFKQIMAQHRIVGHRAG